MARYTADFKIIATVEFDDDGIHDLRDQAFEAMEGILPFNSGFDLELYASTLKPVKDKVNG